MNSLAFDGLPPLRDVLRRHEILPKKSLGQNFLLDLNLTRKIAALSGELDGRVVVEIGPGPGGLTRALLSGGAEHVIAIERDGRCLDALAEIADHWPDRLSVVNNDALEVDWHALVSPHLNEGARALIIANLPYGIATKLLVTWLETDPWPPWFDGMSLMFQREVAERIVANPRSKAFGRLSVLAQWRCACRLTMTLPAAAFTPPPKVASAVVSFRPRPAPMPDCNANSVSHVTAALFTQRRKMLRSSLKQLTAMPELLLDRLGLEPTSRAEELSVEDVVRIAAALE